MALPILAKRLLPMSKTTKSSSNTTTILLTTGLVIGTFLGFRAVVKRFKKNLRQKQVLTIGNPAHFAMQLRLAFENDNTFGWGTNETLVFRTLEAIPSFTMRRKVERAYLDLFGTNLSTDLMNELNTEEYHRAINIINSKT